MPTTKDEIQQNTRSTNRNVASPQSPERAEVASYIWSKFDDKRNERDRPQPLLRDRTLKRYLDDNVKRFTQFKQRPAHKKKWQSNLASTTPFDKLMGILSKIATQGMETRVNSSEDINIVEYTKERVLNAFGKASAIKNNDDFQIILEMLEAGEKGTVIGFEDWYHGNRQERRVLDQDPETGELKIQVENVKDWNDVRGSLVNIEDFYPGNIYVRPGRVQDMDDCFLRTIMTEDEFDAEFGKYPDADKVKTKSSLSVNESTPFWRQSDDIANDEIEVLRYFNKRTDEYVIIANEIWINPMDNSTVQPLPWNHKQLPFWAAIYAPFDALYFYGRSLIDLLIADTDAKDGLFDRMMDQMTLAVSRPVVTDGKAKSALTKGFLQPHNVIQTDWTNGRPNFDTVPINDPPAMGVTLLQLLEQRGEQSSISAEAIGGSTGMDKTATQANIEFQGAVEATNLFRTMMEHGIRDKYRLRYPNMVQFYTLPSNKESTGDRFRKVILRDEKLSNGKTGNLKIEIREDFNAQRVKEKNKQSQGESEIMEVTPEFIRNFRYDVEIIPLSSVKMTPQQKQILELNYTRVMSELFPDLIDRDQAFDNLNRAFEKDTDKMKAKGQSLLDTGPQGEGNGMAQNLAGVGGTPPVRQTGLSAVNELATM